MLLKDIDKEVNIQGIKLMEWDMDMGLFNIKMVECIKVNGNSIKCKAMVAYFINLVK